MKLNHTLQHLNKWGKSNFGNIKLRTSILKGKLLDIQSMSPNPSNVPEEHPPAQELNDLLHLEDTYWKQRAKCNWIRDGDRTTKYFHLRATARKRKNTIQNLQLEDGSWIMIMKQSPTGWSITSRSFSMRLNHNQLIQVSSYLSNLCRLKRTLFWEQYLSRKRLRLSSNL
ncbi:uncharacterized protein M6B38_276600 [Iris pallida]|uniref:Uncharacterized protein n=1 Tax=Iris pallida TaxID=29817 RepID=A0AAX6I3Y5_IRIPA|nr:uncharacterized protein M6B38_276600 [Iris pallida]